jgi:hypothetical protein
MLNLLMELAQVCSFREEKKIEEAGEGLLTLTGPNKFILRW